MKDLKKLFLIISRTCDVYIDILETGRPAQLLAKDAKDGLIPFIDAKAKILGIYKNNWGQWLISTDRTVLTYWLKNHHPHCRF